MSSTSAYQILRVHDLNQLAVLHALLSTQSVTAASEQVGLTQPATSKQLERLRAAFADRLLVRDGNRMRLTPRAQALIPQVEAALRAVSSVFAAHGPFDAARARGRLRIGASDYVQAVLGAPLLQRVRRLAPGLALEFRPVGMLHPEQLLAEGLVDMVVGAHWPNVSLRDRLLYRDPFVCVVGADAPPCPPLDLDAFCALPQVDVSPSGTGMLRTVGQRALGLAEGSRQVVASVSSFFSLPRMLGGSGLAALVPQRALALFPPGAVRRIDLEFNLPSYEVSLWWHNTTHADPVASWIRDHFVELAAEPR